MITLRPPCWRPDSLCPNSCAAQMHQRIAYNCTPLYGPWAGWRMAGARLVSPHGEWIAPHQLDRLMYREQRLFAKRSPGGGLRLPHEDVAIAAHLRGAEHCTR